jgi:hypothetical protein
MGSEMPKLTRKRIALFGSVSVSTVVAVAAVLGNTSNGSAGELLRGVPPDAIQGQGIELTEASMSFAPSITQEAARKSAGFAGVPVREIKLVHVANDEKSPVGISMHLDNDVWAFNFEPTGLNLPGGPVGSAPNKTNYAVAFVDATTGDFLFGFASSTR